MAQLMPLPLTVSCFSKIQIGFTFLVSAHPGSPGKRAVKRVCVCVCSSVTTAAGEQEFSRVKDDDDGTPPVYGTDLERARHDAEFFESVRRGDFRHQSGDRQPDQDRTPSEDSPVETDFMSLDIRTSVEPGGALPDSPIAAAAETDDADLDKSLADVSVGGQ